MRRPLFSAFLVAVLTQVVQAGTFRIDLEGVLRDVPMPLFESGKWHTADFEPAPWILMSLWLDEEDNGILTQDDSEFSYIGIEKLELASQYYVFERSGGLFGQISTAGNAPNGDSGAENGSDSKFVFTTNYRGWPEIGPPMWLWGFDTEDPAHEPDVSFASRPSPLDYARPADYIISTTEFYLNRSVVEIDLNTDISQATITFYAIEIGDYQMWLHPFEYQVTSISVVPEPATALLAAGSLLVTTRRRVPWA